MGCLLKTFGGQPGKIQNIGNEREGFRSLPPETLDFRPSRGHTNPLPHPPE